VRGNFSDSSDSSDGSSDGSVSELYLKELNRIN
jgi:hypothetical protein